eukprot:scaffold4658_cov118-Cylindrotheca_fusiformis.AAC.11
MPPPLSTQYKLRGIGLGLIPISALSFGWWKPLPSLKNSLLLSVSPLVGLAILDVVENFRMKRRLKAAKESFVEESKLSTLQSLAQSGQAKMSKMVPPQTGKVYLIVGTGGVGRRIIEVLQERGEANVYGFDICPVSTVSDFLEESHFVSGDVSSLEACQSVVKKVQPDVIFHTAGIITISDSKTWQWEKSYNVNVRGVLNMLRASTTESKKVGSFVMTGSSIAGIGKQHCHKSVSGNEKEFPPVSSEEEALSWYSRSKALAEVEALEFCKHNSKAPAFGIIRPASGIFHAKDSVLCQPGLLDMNSPAIGFENQRIDFVYGDNVVLGHLLLEKQLSSGKCQGETFIISNKEPMTLLDFEARITAMVPGYVAWKLSSTLVFFLATITELAKSLKQSMPKDLALLSYTTLSMQTVDYIFDCSKAETMLGYEPAFTVAEGLAKTIGDHAKAFPDGGLAKAKQQTKKD